MQIERVIKRQLTLTEKGSLLRDSENKYVFEVDLGANKHQIKEAVETLFNVNVKSINTLVVRGKTLPTRLMRLIRGDHRPNWKKAVVQLAEGQSIGSDEES